MDPSVQSPPPADKEEKSLIEMLYGVAIKDIAQLKTRQWDVTKWVLAANVGLLIAIGNGALLPQYAIGLLSIALGLLAGATIIKTQCSLAGTRARQRKWRCRHRKLGKANMIAGKKKGHEKFWYDWQVWGAMLLIVAISSLVTTCAAWPAVMP